MCAQFNIGTGQSGETGDGETDGGQVSHGGRGGKGGEFSYQVNGNPNQVYVVIGNKGNDGLDGGSNTGMGGLGGIQPQSANSYVLNKHTHTHSLKVSFLPSTFVRNIKTHSTQLFLLFLKKLSFENLLKIKKRKKIERLFVSILFFCFQIQMFNHA